MQVDAAEATTFIFRLSTILVLISIAVGILKLFGAVKERGAFEQRVQTHLDRTEPLIGQFNAMQNAITSGEVRHQAIAERLDRFVSTQENANEGFRESINILMRNRIGEG